MTDYTGKTIFLGIDVHKKKYSTTFICEDVLVKRDTFSADPELLVAFCRRHFKGAIIKSAYEAGFSGFYLHRYLLKNGIQNIVVHAASIEISSRDAVKTDRRDSFKIASQLAANRLRAIYVPSESREDKRILVRMRENIVRQRTRIACQIKSLLELQGLIPYFETIRATKKWVNGLLERIDIKGNFRYVLSLQIKNWNHYNKQLKDLNSQIDRVMTDESSLKVIYRSVPGIGNTAANILINELGDTLQFSSEDKLFSHVGLTPREYSSGEHKRQGHITRQGKPVIRKILVQAAWKAIKIDGSLKIIFDRISKNQRKKIAIVAIARRILGRIRSCCKQQKIYRIFNPIIPIEESENPT